MEKDLPEMVRTRDLVDLGIYASPQAAYQARANNCSPPFIVMPKNRVIYPKCGVIAFLRERSAQRRLRTKDQLPIGPISTDPSLNAQKRA